MLSHAELGRTPTQPIRLPLPPRSQPASAEDDLATIGTRQNVERNREIYAEGDAADRVFRVLSGAVRTVQLLEDGRRQVNAFYLAGEMFGLEAGETYRFSAEAIVPSTLLVVRRDRLARQLAARPALAGALWRMTARELERARAHLTLLGRKTAVERVASFLMSMAERSAGETIELPMGRQDIADFLGLTIETVSRTISLLEERRAIELASARCIRIRDRRPLAAMNA